MILAFISLIATAASGFLLGYSYCWFFKIKRTYKHEHVWPLWEDYQLYDWSSKLCLVPGQKRDCTVCGEREARRVIAYI